MKRDCKVRWVKGLVGPGGIQEQSPYKWGSRPDGEAPGKFLRVCHRNLAELQSRGADEARSNVINHETMSESELGSKDAEGVPGGTQALLWPK